MIRIGLISDTHGFLDERVAHHFRDVDEIWHAGDIGNMSVIEGLQEIAPVKAVYGNIDGQDIRKEFPLDLRWREEGLNIWMTHIGGRPPKYNKRVYPLIGSTRPNVFICGHSHILLVKFDHRIQTMYLNPGAAGIHGFHKVRTLVRFSIDVGKLKDMQVVELGPRSMASPEPA